MRTTLKFGRLANLAILLGRLAGLLFAGSASAATTTLTFKEPEKGSTFAFIGNAPTSTKKHGFPTRLSVGDEMIFTNFVCSGIAKIPGGTLVFVAELAEGNTEGAIAGGSGRSSNRAHELCAAL